MSLPGFTAEASLYRKDAPYQTAAAAPRGAAGVVTPQQLRNTCRDVYRSHGVTIRCCWWNDGTHTCWMDHEGYPGRVV